MAVARIKLEPRQYRTLLARLKPEVRNETATKRLYKELERAKDRPGLLAELMPTELNLLEAITQDMPEVLSAILAAQERIVDCERAERAAAKRIRATLDAVRGSAPGA